MADGAMAAARYPRTQAYLESLPQGIRSFPECKAAAEGYTDTAKKIGERIDPSVFPAPFAAFLTQGYEGRWMPEVYSQMLHALIADLDGEEEMMRWKYEQALALYDRPFVRHLMRIMSPTLIVMGAARRWGAMHQGSSLETTPVKKEGRMSLSRGIVTCPPGLLSHAFCLGQLQAFRAALAGARAADVGVTLGRQEPDRVEYEVRWS